MLSLIKKSPFTFKIFIILFLLNITILLFLTTRNFKSTRNFFTQQIESETWSKLEQTNEYFDMYHENIKSIILSLSLRKELLLSGRKKAISDFLYNFEIAHTSFIDTVYFIDKKSNVYSSRQTLYDIYHNDELMNILELHNKPSLIWTNPYKSTLSGDTIAVSYAITDTDNDFQGLIVVELDFKTIHNYLVSIYSKQSQTFILSNNNESIISIGQETELLFYKPKTYPLVIHEDFYTNLIHATYPSTATYSSFEYKNQKYHVMHTNRNVFLWNLYILVDQQLVNRSISKIFVDNLINTFVLIFVLMVVSYFISYLIAKPIRLITAQMNRVRDYSALQPITLNYKNEFGKMITSYNSMMNRIQNLIKEVKSAEREKKNYELKMLQSQIGPHFLYNTLVCIGSLAKQQRIDEVKITIRSLVTLLSYTFDKTNELVPLSLELENIKSYINIQQIRYGKTISLHTHLLEEFQNYKVPKLLMQPLVENSIFHGILPKNIMGKIIIRTKVRENQLIITVYDNGIGMNDSHSVLEQPHEESIKDKLNSIGLNNTDQRIKLQYGEEYGLKIYSRINVGTVISMRFPIESIE